MNYQATFIDVLQRSTVSFYQESQPGLVEDGVNIITEKLIITKRNGQRIFLFGNGASASIASHIATDFLKTLHLRAIHISDNSLLTCLSNDLGYEQVYAEPLRVHANHDDLVIAISSSGQSENILKAVEMAKELGCYVVTLSGFNIGNPLSKIGDVNFFVPSHSYGFVEVIHTYILHWIVDRAREMMEKF